MDLVSCVSFLQIILKYGFFMPQRKVSDLHGSAQASAPPAELCAKNKRDTCSVPAAGVPLLPGCHHRAMDQIPAWYLEMLLRDSIPS